jgi:hypothetical protein
VQAAGIADGPDHGKVEPIDQHQHHMSRIVRSHSGSSSYSFASAGNQIQCACLVAVAGAQPHQHQPAEREQQHHRPSALAELHHREDQHDQQRHQAAAEVDRELVPPTGLAAGVVVLGHAEASHRETDEYPYRIERNQLVDTGTDSEQQCQRRDGQHQDAVAEGQPMPAPGQLPGQEGVLGDEAGQEREAGERVLAPV